MFLHDGGKTEIDKAWLTYAAAAINGMAATGAHDEVPALCQMAAEIADENVRREAERFGEEDETQAMQSNWQNRTLFHGTNLTFSW